MDVKDEKGNDTYLDFRILRKLNRNVETLSGTVDAYSNTHLLNQFKKLRKLHVVVSERPDIDDHEYDNRFHKMLQDMWRTLGNAKVVELEIKTDRTQLFQFMRRIKWNKKIQILLLNIDNFHDLNPDDVRLLFENTSIYKLRIPIRANYLRWILEPLLANKTLLELEGIQYTNSIEDQQLKQTIEAHLMANRRLQMGRSELYPLLLALQFGDPYGSAVIDLLPEIMKFTGTTPLERRELTLLSEQIQPSIHTGAKRKLGERNPLPFVFDTQSPSFKQLP